MDDTVIHSGRRYIEAGMWLVVLMTLFITTAAAPQTYIVHLRERNRGVMTFEERQKWYASFLPDTATFSEASASRIMYSYQKVISGFAARLSKAEVEAMQTTDGFVQAYPDAILPLQTTYSPQYLGLDSGKGLWPKAGFGKGIIVGVLDSGIWPESPSFNDDGIPPVPKRWKGICQSGTDFNSSHCNNKLIGARFYNRGFVSWSGAPRPRDESPRDSDGHGTHTASTAAGSWVVNADMFGNAKGTARGMAPSAHIAIYKVCWETLCSTSDILAGMDDAIADGVDVLSLSIGGQSKPYYFDTIAIAAFRAMENGIFVTCAGGNGGPSAYSLSNEAPWVTTVGASSVDRNFVGKVILGNGNVLYGESIGLPGKHIKALPLVWGADQCVQYTLNSTRVAGKIVVCDRGDNVGGGEGVRGAGGKAMIMVNGQALGDTRTVDAEVLDVAVVGFKDGVGIKDYINSSHNPTATIEFEGTVFGMRDAPAVAAFSSRGPSLASPSVLKPDLIAPGVNVLAAWPLDVGPSGVPTDKRRVRFNIKSGTSMATPHVSGIAALLKSAHPDWSPAAIKSALVTTACSLNNRGRHIFDDANNSPATLFAIGAGQVNPQEALDPGLVYDVGVEDYLLYLCSLNYTSVEINLITNRNFTCLSRPSTLSGDHLNYPSFSVIFLSTGAGSARAISQRTVTNVGPAVSTYSVQVVAPKGVQVTVTPTQLSFNRANEKKSYSVTFVAEGTSSHTNSFAEGYLVWVSSDSHHKVRSPISITWN